jgi:cytochrome o ubiquinol oxidase subunit IV
MDKNPHAAITHHGANHGTLRSYVMGFVLSIALTIIPYAIVSGYAFSRGVIVAAIVGLGVAQLLVQLVFFLHLGRESKPRWNLIVFFFMLLVVVIILGGTLWIMSNLNYNTMSRSPFMGSTPSPQNEH